MFFVRWHSSLLPIFSMLLVSLHATCLVVTPDRPIQHPEKNANEQKTYEDKKAGNGIKCTFRGCPFVAKNEKGLKSHWSQKHKYVEDTSSESDDSNDDAEEVAPRRPMTSTTPSATSTSNCSKYICPHCKKDCSSGSGLSSHLRHSKLCKAPAADRPK